MMSPQWILAGPLIAVFASLAILNAVLFVGRYMIRPARMPSMVPFIGGIAGAYGFHSAPLMQLQQIAWLPLLLDCGCVPLVLLAIWVGMRQKPVIRKDK